MLIHRRLFDARIRSTSSFGDIAILLMLYAQLILGHSRLAVTLEIYSHEDRQGHRDAVRHVPDADGAHEDGDLAQSRALALQRLDLVADAGYRYSDYSTGVKTET